MMELAFASRRLRTLCEEPNRSLDHLKPQVVESLKRRLADLNAAESPLDLPAGSPRMIGGTRPRLVLRLAEGYFLNCAVNHEKLPLTAQGTIDWRRIRRLRITSIKELGDEH